jgi:hypothetical protein
MTWRVAKSLLQLRDQINAAYPNRDHTSDGTIGDARHQAEKSSDHNPWVKDSHGIGVVTGMDTDEDLSPSIHSIEGIVDAIRKSRDRRVKYIIYEKRITVKDSDLQEWKPYHGVNPHDHHAHISVFPDPALYDDDAPWDIGDAVVISTPVTVGQPELRIGAKGDAVKRLQLALRAHGEMIDVDEDFGPATERAVKNFQEERRLRSDGIAGKQTNAALGL